MTLEQEVQKAARIYVRLYNQKDPDGLEYKFSKSYTLNNFLNKFDIREKRFLRYESEKSGQFCALAIKLTRKAREKGHERESKTGKKIVVDWQKIFYRSLPKDLRKKVYDIESGNRLTRDAAELFVSLYDKNGSNGLEYKFSKQYTLCNFLDRFDIKDKSLECKKEIKMGQFGDLLQRLRKKAKKKGYERKGIGGKKTPDWQKAFYKLLPPKLAKKVQDIESDSRLAREAAELFIGLYDEKDTNGLEHKFSESYRLGNLLSKFNIRENKFLKNKRGISHGQFNALAARLRKKAKEEEYERKGIGLRKILDWKKAFYELLPLRLAKKVQDIESGNRLTRDAADLFVGLYNQKNSDSLEYKFSESYTLCNFLIRFNIKEKIFLGRKECGGFGQFYALFYELRNKAKKEGYERKDKKGKVLDWRRVFYELLIPEYPDLAKKVQNIESDRRLAREAAELFVSLYDERGSDGLEHKLSGSYTLHNFLNRFDIKKNIFLGYKKDVGFGQFCALLGRLKNKAKKIEYEKESAKGKTPDWQRAFYELLPPELAKQVQYVESGQRLKDETDERNLRIMKKYVEK